MLIFNYVCMCTVALHGQKGTLTSPGTELQAIMTHLTQMLGTENLSSARAEEAPGSWTISLAQWGLVLFCFLKNQSQAFSKCALEEKVAYLLVPLEINSEVPVCVLCCVGQTRCLCILSTTRGPFTS